MPVLHIVILALVQGITEFLPVSSSGHLVLAHDLIGRSANDLTIDIAVHVGTLFAALLYFRADICRMLCGLRALAGKEGGQEGKQMLLALIIASIPVILAGFALHLTGTDWTRSVYLVAWCTFIFGIVLGIADTFKPADKKLETITIKDAIFIGCAQMLALIPGVSRSGITMTAARWLGFSRTDSARFSLLLAIVAISGAGTLTGIDLLQAGDPMLTYQSLIAVLLSFISGLAAIFLMMKWLETASFKPFVFYRLFLGIILLTLLYGGFIEP